MSSFQENLAQLPNIDHLAAVHLHDATGQIVASIINQPGSGGSVRVYYALAERFGMLNTQAAIQGLQWYAEHTTDAAQFPGKHPNIDRLFALQHGHCPPLTLTAEAKSC